MANYGENYNYGMSPTYKDGGNAGMILVSKIDSTTGNTTPKNFPVLDVVPVGYKFGFTGLGYAPKAFLWDFGDGSSSSDPNPVHTYNTHGFHKIFLSIKNYSGEWSYIVGIYDHLVALGKLEFSGEPRIGDKPLVVNFLDNSLAPTGSHYTGIQWDFGDTQGATGAQPAPHTYTDYGSYSVGINAFLDVM